MSCTADEDGGKFDSPAFVQQMHGWIAQNNVAYQAYFDTDASADNNHRSTEFPHAQAAYQRLFGH